MEYRTIIDANTGEHVGVMYANLRIYVYEYNANTCRDTRTFENHTQIQEYTHTTLARFSWLKDIAKFDKTDFFPS